MSKPGEMGPGVVSKQVNPYNEESARLIRYLSPPQTLFCAHLTSTYSLSFRTLPSQHIRYYPSIQPCIPLASSSPNSMKCLPCPHLRQILMFLSVIVEWML